jgi:hypothetical protein
MPERGGADKLLTSRTAPVATFRHHASPEAAMKHVGDGLRTFFDATKCTGFASVLIDKSFTFSRP